jgi:hypothetical protein
MERLKAKEATVVAGASAQEGARAGDAVQPSEWVEVAPGASELDRSRGDGQELGSTTRTLEAVEVVEAATSAHGIGQANFEEARVVVETPQDMGEEEKQPKLQTEREEPLQ